MVIQISDQSHDIHGIVPFMVIQVLVNLRVIIGLSFMGDAMVDQSIWILREIIQGIASDRVLMVA